MADNKEITLWEELDGVKDNIAESLSFKLGEKEFSLEVKFVDLDVVQDINEIYEGKKSSKPTIKVPHQNGMKNIKVPTAEERYEKFNTHDKAKKWIKDNKKHDKMRNYHLAHKFLADKYKPSKDVEESIEILKSRLRYTDILKIVNKGLELNGFSEQLGEQRDDS